MGAQRVKANFAEIEREAELADQLKIQESSKSPVPEKTSEEQESQVCATFNNLSKLYKYYSLHRLVSICSSVLIYLL